MRTCNLRLVGGPWGGRTLYLAKPGNNFLDARQRKSLAISIGGAHGHYNLITGRWEPL